MDFPKRILKVVRDNGGVAVFMTFPKPNPVTGFAVVYNSQSYGTTDPNLLANFRSFVKEFGLQGHGIAAYRRTTRVIFGNFDYFPDEATATNFAQANKIQYIYNLGTNTSINLGAFDPQLPGDGVSDE